MSWEQYRRRKAVIDNVLLAAAAQGTDELPDAFEPAIRATFGDRKEFLLALHYRWHHTLHTRLELALDAPVCLRPATIERIRAELAAEWPALHAILRRNAEDPAILDADRWYEQQSLRAVRAGTTQDTSAATGPPEAAQTAAAASYACG